MKIKTSELKDTALDWAVKQIEDGRTDGIKNYSPSTNWDQGGPIIEREKISLVRYGDSFTTMWEAFSYCDAHYIDSSPGDGSGIDGPTPLIAAMRVYVASKLGDEIDVPEELI